MIKHTSNPDMKKLSRARGFFLFRALPAGGINSARLLLTKKVMIHEDMGHY